MKSQVLDGGCVLIEFPRRIVEKELKWRSMTGIEAALALALRDHCIAGHRLPPRQWAFVKAMAGIVEKGGGSITDKQAKYLHGLGCDQAAEIEAAVDRHLNRLIKQSAPADVGARLGEVKP